MRISCLARIVFIVAILAGQCPTRVVPDNHAGDFTGPNSRGTPLASRNGIGDDQARRTGAIECEMGPGVLVGSRGQRD